MTLHPHHHRYTLPPTQAKTVLKSVFLNKINTLSVVILDILHSGHQKFYDPLFFFPKFHDPPCIWDPYSEENDNPLMCDIKVA